ncbi:alpha/beta hydrolase [Winogradskyella tangerina]|uniref:alpha/beta hydrolase n=1 Tax=Winogradskyella tangerina TaxID=2023240 RepID=UPI000DBE3E91|nr:alpha/beta hydrolase-fold protein [Winogradskyella tangerina]
MKKLVLVICCCLILSSCKNEKTEETDVSIEAKTSELAHNFVPVNTAKLASGKLARLDSLPSKYITSRPVDVWLPDNYSEDKKYAVLYMHDGQMLFDAETTWNKQEWKVDEWASQLMSEGKTKDFIVVAIHNISDIRWQDLFPQKAFDYIDQYTKESLADIAGKKDFDLNGDNYLKFIVEELKPLIDGQYSVHTDQSNTFVMGSSMGGLMSMYAISEYPDVFGGAACLSTHWVGARPQSNNPYPDAIFKYMSVKFPQAGKHKAYFDYGNKTLDQYYPQHAPRVDEILEAKGYTEADSKNIFFEDTDHSENSWNQRLDEPLVFLLGKD